MNNNNNEELRKGSSVFFIELTKIEPNPYQPRIEFNEDKLNALAESIKQYGILQPIVVSRKEEYSEEFGIRTKYQIIAGERRFRASKIAGLNQIPAIIREKEDTDAEKLELAIIENLQREDLNPVDKARAFRKLADDFGLKHTQIAKKMGKSREYVSNAMRILMLPEAILGGLIAGKITEGHTRSLLMLKDREVEQAELYKRIVADKLTVRAAEKLARSIAVDKIRKKIDVDPEIKKIQIDIESKLGTKVSIDQKPIGDGGKLTIEYFNKDDLRKILAVIENNEKSIPFVEKKDFIQEDESHNSFENIQPTIFKEELNNIEQFGNVEREEKKDFTQEDELHNSFESVEPTIFKEELNNIEQFGNAEKEEEKVSGFIGFSIGNVDEKTENNSTINIEKEEVEDKILKDSIENQVKNEIEEDLMKIEREIIIEEPVVVPEKEIEEPVIVPEKKQVNNFTNGGFFKKFSFGRKKEELEKQETESVDELKEIKNNNPVSSVGAKNNFKRDEFYVDGLEKIEIKNDFDKSRIESLKKTDDILGSFGEKKSQNQVEIDKLLAGISTANEIDIKNNNLESKINDNLILESNNGDVKNSNSNTEYSDFYNQFLESKGQVKEDQKKQFIKKDTDDNYFNNHPGEVISDKIEVFDTGFQSFGNEFYDKKTKGAQSKIVEENGLDIDKKNEDLIEDSIKTKIISSGDGFMAAAQDFEDRKKEEKKEIVPGTEDDKYSFKGFSL